MEKWIANNKDRLNEEEKERIRKLTISEFKYAASGCGLALIPYI